MSIGVPSAYPYTNAQKFVTPSAGGKQNDSLIHQDKAKDDP